ncbi:MAG: ArsR family transcriptional regulator [Ilumatobacteraceae bacterium]|nr:ArsR family transcriptional regulator [Ilumatobacteraceae bacterium]
MSAADDAYGMDDVFRALSDPSRRSLLDSLNQHNGQTLRELCAGLAMARQSVSKHLAVLEAAHVVTTQRRGREKLHFLNAAPINAIADRWIDHYDRPRAAALADLTTALEQQPMTTTTTSARRAPEFVYVTYIKTTPEQLWQAITDPAFTRRYWGVALISDWHVGSPVAWEFAGITMADPAQTVLAADAPRRLAYTWHAITPEFAAVVDGSEEELAAMAAEDLSHVTFDLEPVGEMVKLTVTHAGFEPGSAILGGITNGWPSILASLKTLLETGEPLVFD